MQYGHGDTGELRSSIVFYSILEFIVLNLFTKANAKGVTPTDNFEVFWSIDVSVAIMTETSTR